MLNVTSIKKSKNTTKVIETSKVSRLGLPSSPLRVESQIQYFPVYGISTNVIANYPVLQNFASAYSSNHNDVLHGNTNVLNTPFGVGIGYGEILSFFQLTIFTNDDSF